MSKWFILLILPLLFSYSVVNSYFTCNSCSDCVAALNNNTFNEVHLIANITSTTTCIDNPENFTNKTFSCDFNEINGTGDYGILMTGKTNVNIVNCTIKNFTNGIYINESNASIYRITSKNSSNGIYIINSKVRGSTFILEGNNIGIYFYNAFNSSLTSINSILNNYETIYAYSSYNLSLTSINASNEVHGILFSSTNNSSIVNLTSENNTYGLSFENCYWNNLTNMTIKNNTYGLNISGNYNLIYNNFFNNTNYNVSGTNYFNTTKHIGYNIIGDYYIGGNYWGNTCSDNDRDGICDSPYTISSGNVDYLPLTNLTPYIAPLQIIVYEEYGSKTTSGYESTATITEGYGYINISNNDPSGDFYNDVYVAVDLSSAIVNDSGYLHIIQNTTGGNVSIIDNSSLIPEEYKINRGADRYIYVEKLPVNTSVLVRYKINLTQTLPLSLQEEISPDKIIATYQQEWQVNLTVFLNTSIQNNITFNLTKELSNSSSNYGSENWTNMSLVYISSTQGLPFQPNPTTLNWNNIVLNSSVPNASLVFNVSAKSNVSNTTLQDYGYALIKTNVRRMSNLTIVDVFALNPSGIGADKAHNGTDKWVINATYYDFSNIVKGNVTYIAVWATEGNLSNESIIPNSLKEEEPNVTVLPYATYMIWNNITYNDTPTVWANVTFKMIPDRKRGYNVSDGINNSYNLNYTLIEQIYVVRGYLIKATKKIEKTENGYIVYVILENVGSDKTPYVYVYDLIPNNFTVQSIEVINSSLLVETQDGQNYSGKINEGLPSEYSTSYYWAFKSLNPYADGSGDPNDTTEIQQNQSVVIKYILTGSGDLRDTDLFLAGVDPRHSLSKYTVNKITLNFDILFNNKETFLVYMFTFVSTLFVSVLLKRGNK